MKDVSSLMQSRIKGNYVALFNSIAQVAADYQVGVYVVGGFVRDLLLNTKNLDIDLVIEGDAISFTKKLAEKFDGQVESYEKFGTSTLRLEGRISIDVATARTEYYSYPAALPEVKPSKIKSDLFRRDFTINSMAIKLAGQGEFFLIDLFNGEVDLKNGLIRVLHDRSFVDDPCRIFRAIRFEQRFDFCIEDKTKKFINKAVESSLIAQLSGDRLINEIKILLNESSQVKCVDRMRELSILQTIAPEIFVDDFHWIVMEKLESALVWADMLLMPKKPEVWFVYFYTLFMVTKDEVFKGMMERLHFPRNIYSRMCSERECLTSAKQDLNKKKELKPSEVYDIFSKQSSETVVLLLAICSSERVKKYAELYFEKYSMSAKIELNGDDLIGMGIKPGPICKEILKAWCDARVNGQVKSREEEIILVRSRFVK